MAERSEAVEQQAVRDASAVYSVEPEIATSEDLPPGYKRTEVGVIPEDWSVIELGELARFTTGPFGTALHKADYINGGIPLINPMHIVDSQLSPDSETSVSADAARRLSPYRMRASDIVIGRRGDMGRCAVVGEGQVGWLCGTGSLIIRCSDGTNAIFVQRILTTERVIAAIEDSSVGSTMTNLNQGVLSRLKIQLPSMPERHAIATALSDADALIESLNRLIAKKRAIKQAAMQQLLTGLTRLPGFTGEWETKRLGDVGTFFKGQGIRRDDVSDEGVPCIRYGEIYTRYGDCVLTPESRIPKAVAEAAFPLRTGDILFAGSGETAEEIGMCVAYLGEQPAFAGGDIVVLRPNEGVSAYLGRLLNHPTIAQQKARFGQGDAVVHISARNLAQIQVRLPQEKEQTAIATVLSDMDTEIEALERRHDKARQTKQGMMQQLLTGRVRLVQPNVAHAEVGAKPEATKGHSKQFNEAVVISMLARHFGTEEFPLGRKRYTKLSYLLHRHTDGKVEDYLKKAAGPYNPKTKYGGAEKIALKKGYLKEHKGPRGHSGFILADNVAEAERYFHNWYGPDVVRWLDQFRFKSNDELEVLATVDMAAQELRAGGHEVDVSSVKGVIQSDAEWKSKLNRKVFSDENIAQAIALSESLLRPTRKEVT